MNPKHHVINPYFKLESDNVIPIIDRRFPLSEVPEAFRYLEEGHVRGKVVITVEHNSN